MDIKLEHIRIGNWFISQNGNPFQWSLQDFCLVATGTDIADIIKEPVVLDDAVFALVNFESGYIGHWNNYDAGIELEFDKTGYRLLNGESMFNWSKEYKYLHELQNISADLSNYELPVNLSELHQSPQR